MGGTWLQLLWALAAVLPSSVSVGSGLCPVGALQLPRLSVVTGAAQPGGLGFEVAARLSEEVAPAGGTVLLTGRDPRQGSRALDALMARGITNVEFDELDVADLRSIESFSARFRPAGGGRPLPDLLINNAAVLMPGSGAEAMAASMRTHVWGPVCLMRRLDFMCDGVHARTAEGGAARRAVVNVSSGDGELAMLHSEIRQALEAACTPADVLALGLADPTARALLSMDAGSGEGGRTARSPSLALGGVLGELVEQGEELAFGPTPTYSVSKASLNALTRVAAAGGGSTCPISAVCPGDIVGSRMYSGDGSGEWDVSVTRAGTCGDPPLLCGAALAVAH